MSAQPKQSEETPNADVPEHPPTRQKGGRGAGRKHNVQLPPEEQRASPDPKTGEGSRRRD